MPEAHGLGAAVEGDREGPNEQRLGQRSAAQVPEGNWCVVERQANIAAADVVEEEADLSRSCLGEGPEDLVVALVAEAELTSLHSAQHLVPGNLSSPLHLAPFPH